MPEYPRKDLMNERVLFRRRRGDGTASPARISGAIVEQVRDLIRQLRSEGLGIFLVSHDIHDVFDLADRISVMYHGRIVDTVEKTQTTIDALLAMIILGKRPDEASKDELKPLSL